MAVSKASAAMLDFTNVKDRGDFNPVHVEAGEYALRVVSVVDQESKNGAAMWVFGFQHVSAPIPTAARATYPFYCVLDAKSLWKVRGLFVSAGFNVPKSKINLDPNRLIGRVVGAILEDDEYEGKVRSKIAQVMPADEIDGAAAASPTEESDPDADGYTPPVTDDDLTGVDL